jgi:hypothetical protein
MRNEPEAAVKSLSDEQLKKAHDGLHETLDAQGITKSDQIAAHHYLAQELRERGLVHPDSDSEVHKAVVEMSVVKVPVGSLAKRLSAKEVEAVVEMAVKNGTPYANVHEMLTANGWVLSASPGESEEGEEDEAEEYGWDLTERQKALMEATDKVVEEHGKYGQSGNADDAHYMGASENPFRSKGLKCVNCVAFHGGRACEWVEGDIDPEALCKLWIIPQSVLGTSVSTKSVSLSLRSNQQTVMATVKNDPTSNDVHVDGVNWKTPKKKKKNEGILEDEEDDKVGKSLVVKSVDEMMFTLGPWYVPNKADAHNEWTDQLELQKSLWEYVRKGDRTIRLQHTPDTKAGEWVEAMTMPFDIEVPMLEPDTKLVSKKVFPEGTVFLGVVWEPWAWEMVKKGEIRGYSIGGSAERHELEIPAIMVDLEEGE